MPWAILLLSLREALRPVHFSRNTLLLVKMLSRIAPERVKMLLMNKKVE